MGKAYNQIANQDLQNLGLQTRPAREDLLQNSNENVAHGRTDEHSVERHLRHAGAEVMAMLADIMSKPRGDEFLQSREDTGREHLCAKGVRLELFQVGLLYTSLALTAIIFEYRRLDIQRDNRCGCHRQSSARRPCAPGPLASSPRA